MLTQLDFCYLFEYLCAKENKKLILECNAYLDAKGIDAKVNDIEFQIAKITHSKEARSASRRKVLIIPYPVFDVEDLKRRINSPRVKEEKKTHYQKLLKAFSKYFTRLDIQSH